MVMLVWSCKSEIKIRDAQAAFAEEERMTVVAPVSVCVSVCVVMVMLKLWAVKPVVSLVDG